MDYNLENKKVLITGATGGIGSSLCKNFINSKCKIICTSSDLNKIDDLKNLYGREHSYYFLNLRDVSSINDSLKKITDENNDIDIIINNAGVTIDNIFLRMKPEQWNDVININLNSNYYILKELLPNMIKRKNGCIIGIASVVAITGNPGQTNYTASKAAMISMYKSLAIEVAQRNIRVNTIAPGFIDTPMIDKMNKNQVDSIMERIPMKKLGKPEDIANLALFLSSDKSTYITGQTFHINGGMLMV